MVGRKVGYMCSLQSISERRASPEWRRSITTAFSNAMLNSSTCRVLHAIHLFQQLPFLLSGGWVGSP